MSFASALSPAGRRIDSSVDRSYTVRNGTASDGYAMTAMPGTTFEPMMARERDLRILLVRFGAVCDVLKTSAVTPALRERFPHAYLTWVTDRFTAPLVRANPNVDEIITINWQSKWSRLIHLRDIPALTREYHACIRQLRLPKYDVAIDFHGTPTSALFTRLTDAVHRVGPEAPGLCNRWCYTEHVPRLTTPVRFTHADIALLSAMNIRTAPARPVLAIPEEETGAAREVLASLGWDGEPYLACCPAPSSRVCKGWVPSRWGELADMLWRRLKLRTVFIGGPEQRADLLRMVEGHASRPISVAGRTTLLQSAALAQNATVVIGCDAGLTYAGLATNTPTVVLHGPTEPSHLIDEPSTAVCFHPMPCAPCRHPSCKHFDCMAAITVNEVAETTEKLLERTRKDWESLAR